MIKLAVGAKWSAFAFCSVLLAAATIGPQFVPIGRVNPVTNPSDFRAFYCAGKVVVANRDPLKIEPLRACEHEITKQMGLEPIALTVSAVPQPPYSLALFALLSLIPFPAASCAWLTLLLCCTVITVALLRQLTQLPTIMIALVVVCGNFLAFMSGELSPVVLCSLVLAANIVASGGYALAAATCVTVASIVPNVSLPASISLWFLQKTTRLWLIVWAVCLVVLSVTLFGPAVWLDYFTKELPVHALSEIHALGLQYSLSMLLAFIGVPEQAAIWIGELQYVTMVTIGIVVSRKISATTQQNELHVLIPPAFAICGGTFIHLYQLVIVVPAALCIMSRADRYVRTAMVIAILGVLASMALDLAFASSLNSPLASKFFAEMRLMRGDDLASSAMKYWHEDQRTHDPAKIVATFLLKVPAVLGLCVFVATTIWLSYGSVRARHPSTRSLRQVTSH